MKSAEQLISQEYHCVQKIGNGTFGYVFSVQSKINGRLYACKIEKTTNRKTILVQKEFRILTQLMQTKKFPLVYSLKTLTTNSYLIMQKFDRSLDDIFEQNNKQFEIKTIALICHLMINSLQVLHKAGYIHRDLKPQNMMIKANTHELKLIDFGLADHYPAKISSSLIGNVRYASKGAHLGQSSPKDDLQGLIYCLFYFVSGQLPWQNSTTQDIQRQISRRNQINKQFEMTYILQRKHKFLNEFVFPKTKNKIKLLFFEQLKKLAINILESPNKFQPNYSQINQIVQKLLFLANVNKDSCFQWCSKNCQKKVNPEDFWNVFA